jgi:general secretion pathway protein D
MVITSVNLWDGQTVMLGGLISENISKMKDKVPVLGDLPLLGRFFRSEYSYSQKANLMIFVTATIIDPAGNRVHTEEEMPFAKNSYPLQPTGSQTR